MNLLGISAWAGQAVRADADIGHALVRDVIRAIVEPYHLVPHSGLDVLPAKQTPSRLDAAAHSHEPDMVFHPALYPTQHGIPPGTVSHAAQYPTGTVFHAAQYPTPYGIHAPPSA